MSLDFNSMNEVFEYESPQSLLYKFYRQEPARCSSCGTTYRYFLQSGRFGCARCYETFAAQLQKEVLPRMQRSNRYVGRKYGSPCRFASSGQEQENKDKKENKEFSSTQVQTEQTSPMSSPETLRQHTIQTLRVRLKEAVQQEDYEQAAQIRDEIGALQKGGQE